MAIQSTLLEAAKLQPSSIIELFVLDGRNVGLVNSQPGYGGVFRFHGGTNGYYGEVIFDGYAYKCFPFEATDFSYDGAGQLPRPRLKVINARGFVSQLVINNNNLVGAKIIRKRVFARFLDEENFPSNENPFGTPNPDGAFPDEIFYINRKINEDRYFIEFELASQLEVEKVTLPNRRMYANVCVWKYRGEGCGYAGAPKADSANKRFVEDYGLTLSSKGEWNSTTSYSPGDYVYKSSTLDINTGEKFYYVCITAAQGENDDPQISNKWVPDVCSKSFVGCRRRFGLGIDAQLPASFFPGTTKLSY